MNLIKKTSISLLKENNLIIKLFNFVEYQNLE